VNANHLGGALLQRARACKCHCAPPNQNRRGSSSGHVCLFSHCRHGQGPWPLPDSPRCQDYMPCSSSAGGHKLLFSSYSHLSAWALQTWRCRPQGQQQKISHRLIEKCSHHINLFVTLEPTRRALTKSENKRWLQYRSIKQRSTIPAASPSVFLQNIYWYSTTLIFFSSFFIHVIQPTGSS
jgi:hypothetical protein